MDIPNELIFGFNPPPINHPKARRLKIKDPRCVKRYNEKQGELCTELQIYQQMDNLHRTVSDPITNIQQIEYKEIDKLMGNIMDRAEKECRNICTGTIVWSPTY